MKTKTNMSRQCRRFGSLYFLMKLAFLRQFILLFVDVVFV